MPLSDYEHWNEDATYMWWHEEGKHPYEPGESDPDDRSLDAADAYAEELAEKSTQQIEEMLADEEYLARWPKTKPLLEWELKFRGAR